LEPLDRVPGMNRVVVRQVGDKPCVTVELDDEWEEFTVVFSVNHPSKDFNDKMMLDGNVTSIDLLKMERVKAEEDWMNVKFGEPMIPWKVEVQMTNNESGDDGKWKAWTESNMITYKYELKN
jgi:hypothetical protein